MQQLPTFLSQQYNAGSCCVHVGSGLQTETTWDPHCIVGRMQPIRLWRPCVVCVRGPNNVRRAVQTDPTLLSYGSAITEQKKCRNCWLKSLTALKLCATTPNKMPQGVQTDATCYIQQCYVRLHGALSYTPG